MPAGSIDDVIGAWNDVCETYNYLPLDGVNIETTQYYEMHPGGINQQDSDGLMEAIRTHEDVMAETAPDPGMQDYLSAILEDEAWY